MSANNLTGSSPAATRAQLLHIGTGVLASGAVVRLGDGTATALTVSDVGIAAPVVSVGEVAVKPSVWKRLTSSVVATNTTPVALTELSFTPENSAVYELEMLLIVTSAATTGGAQIANTGGAGTLYLGAPQSATAAITATGGSYSPTSSPVAGTWILQLKGVFIASSTAALTFSINSDSTDDVTALTGSFLSVTKIS